MPLDSYYRAQNQQLNRGGEVRELYEEIVCHSDVIRIANAPITIPNVIYFRYSQSDISALERDFLRFEFTEVNAETYAAAYECASNPALLNYNQPVSRCGLGEQ